MDFPEQFDVIVIGGGHAGTEAAAAAARMGAKTLLLTQNIETIGQMSCNPAIGGLSKGQIVKEMDILGGMMGLATEFSAIQFKILNQSKGKSVWSPRAQVDKRVYESFVLNKVITSDLDIIEGEVVDIIHKDENIEGIILRNGSKIEAKSVVLTCGTFLNGLIHVGDKNFGGGRVGEKSSVGITADLESDGFKSGRLKTGAPPRVDGRSLDYSVMEEQPGDKNPAKFSYLESIQPLKHQISCYITYTNRDVHDIMSESFSRSPMFNGSISSTGGSFTAGQEFTVTATAEKDYQFTGWTGVDSNENPLTITVNSNQTIQANFKKKKYPLTINIKGNGTVTEELVSTSRSTEYEAQSVVRLTPNEREGESIFLKWTGDITGTCLLYTSPSPRDATLSRMPSSA